MVQKWSRPNRSRGPTEKSSKESDSSWFETLGMIEFLFPEPLWIMKTLGWRSKKRTARGPPDFARRGPLGRRGRRVLRTMIIQNHANHISMHMVTHGGVLGARAPRDFRVRGGDLRGFGGEFLGFQKSWKVFFFMYQNWFSTFFWKVMNFDIEMLIFDIKIINSYIKQQLRSSRTMLRL